MGRNVAPVGVALATAGTVILVRAQPPPQVSATVPIDRLVNAVLSFLPLVGAMCASVGGIMIALAIVAAVAGRLPAWGHPSALLWLGLAATALAVVVEEGVMSLVLDSAQPTGLLAVAHGAGVLRTTGAALLACWLTARITGSGSSGPVPRGASVERSSVGE